jgi:hypothetical protein
VSYLLERNSRVDRTDKTVVNDLKDAATGLITKPPPAMGRNMNDYGEMQKVLRSLNERAHALTGAPCPNGNCFGTLRQLDGELVCTGEGH